MRESEPFAGREFFSLRSFQSSQNERAWEYRVRTGVVMKLFERTRLTAVEVRLGAAQNAEICSFLSAGSIKNGIR
jgi:hypothetical protein